MTGERSDDTPSFAAVLRRYRRAAGLTHEALAEVAGLGSRTISDLERGVSAAPRRETLAALTDALRLEPEQRAVLEAAARGRTDPVGPGGATSRAHNLPVQLTSFVGRAREVGEARARLASCRLVTLTGTGGCGKTRLALRVAAAALEAHRDGAWFVDLAPLADEALVPQALMAALGLRDAPDGAPQERLVDHLRGRAALVVLDNCEHLVAACARLVDALLRGCPRLRVLATSRELLGVAGEAVWRVPSLGLPDAGAVTASAVAECEAGQLFVERARLVQPDFAVTDTNAAAVGQVCRRLDGIPLALELAAARLRGMTVEQIAARLDDRFRLLTSGTRTALGRQQTLRAMVDWSHDLLSEPERAVLRRLAVFAGGFGLEAAEAVCAGGPIAPGEVLDLLLRLVDKSLVLAEARAGAARYRLLETIRQYAQERLLDAGEATATRSRHRDWCLALAERAAPALTGPDQRALASTLEAEHDNLRAALEWSHADDNGAEAEVRLAGALGQFWIWQGYNAEGRARLAGALARRAGVVPAALLAPALTWAGWLDALRGDLDRARAPLVEGLALARAAGDRRLTAQALRQLASLASAAGDEVEACALLGEALSLARQAGAQHETAMVLHILGRDLRRQGDDGAARRLLDEGLAVSRAAGDRTSLALILEQLGQLAIDAGDYSRARDLLEEGMAEIRAIDFKHAINQAHGSLGDLALAQGDLEAAQARYRDSLVAARDWGDRYQVSQALIRLAGLSAARGQHRRAARLFGAGDSARRVFTQLRQGYEHGVAAARAALGEEAFATASRDGLAMTLEEAVAEALEEKPRGCASDPAGSVSAMDGAA